MDQNSNYITIEMTLRLQMLCRVPHIIFSMNRWIVWAVIVIKLISSLCGQITTHKSEPALPPLSDRQNYSRPISNYRQE